MPGPFVVLQFDDPSLEDLVYLESAGDATIRDDAEATARYLDRFTTLEKQALPPEESIALMEDGITKLAAARERTPAVNKQAS